MDEEKRILHELASSWVSLAAEYAGDAPGVTAYYIYGSEERGASFANAYFEQEGKVVFPGRIVGAGASDDDLDRLQDLLIDDMIDATDAFEAAGIPAPTEYRLEYRLEGGKLDLQLSREELYGEGGRQKSQMEGIEYWLGDRAPKLIPGG